VTLGLREAYGDAYRAYVETRALPGALRAIREARATGQAEASRFALQPLLRRLSADCASVVDVGTGLMHSLERSRVQVRIGLDAHRPYLENRRVEGAVPLNASALSLTDLFVDGAVDLITAIDVIEHFEPADAHELLSQAERVAAKRVALFTPRGHFPQDDHDAYGLGGEELQRHRSTWEPEDLTARGYRVVVLRQFHGPWNPSFVEAFGAEGEPRDALLAWRDVAPS
jgi:hypothetical protein